MKRHPDNGLLVKTLSGHSLAITALASSSRYLASASHDCTVRIWSMNDYSQIHCFQSQNSAILKLCSANKVDKLIGCSSDFVIKVYDPSQGTDLYNFREIHKKKVNALIILNSGFAASGSDDTNINVWDILNGRILKSLQSNSTVCALTELVNKILISGYEDKSIRIWNLESYTMTHEFIAHNGPVVALESLNAFDFVSSGLDKTIKIWGMKSKGIIQVLNVSSSETSLAKLSSARLASISTDNALKIWHLGI